MKQQNYRLLKNVFLCIVFVLGLLTTASAQVYQHNFGTAVISSHPYTVPPSIQNADILNSAWTNSTGAWTSFGGSSGQAITLANSSGTPTITLNFTVATNKQLAVSSFNFWRQRSTSGAPNWSMAINGIAVGSGSVPTTGAPIGVTNVANPVTGLTGSVSVVITLNGASGAGNFRLDDFTLNGTITPTCTPAAVTSIVPASGPAGTEVIINGSGFTTGTGTNAVTFSGTNASSFTVVSNTVIRATVPSGATTGPIAITTNNCTGTGLSFTVFNSTCLSGIINDLLISEVYDAQAGDNGAIEIYNGTGAAVNLSAYSLVRYGDVGGSVGFTLPLSGIVQNESTVIFRKGTNFCAFTGNPSPELPSGFNADDEFELVKNGVVIDNFYAPDNVGYTMIRNANAIVPKAQYDAADWAISNSESCADLDFHTINTVVTSIITSQPEDDSVCQNGQATFSVAISNTTGFTYQWKVLNSAGQWVNVVNGANYAGATTSILTVNAIPQSFNGNQYYCQISSAACNLISNAAQLTVFPLPTAPLATLIQPTCLVNTGTITIVAGAGLTYSIGGVYVAGNVFTVQPGTYNVTVQNASGCISPATVLVINPAPLTPAAPVINITQPTCTNPTATVTITAVNGLTYSFNGSAFTSQLTYTTTAGSTVTVIAQNVAGCDSPATVQTVSAVPNAPTAPTVTITQPTCTNPTATVTVTAVNGLTYSYNGGAFTSQLTYTAIAGSTVTVIARNVAGCDSPATVQTVSAVPNAPTAPTVTITQPTCTNPTATVTITAVNGLTYSYNGSLFTSQLTYTANAGETITVIARNAGGCDSPSTIQTVNAAPATPASPIVNTTQPTCTNPIVIVTIAGETGLTYSYNGSLFTSQLTYTANAGETITVIARNAGGCDSPATVQTVSAVPNAPTAPTVTITQPTCTNSIATVTIMGEIGFTYSYNGSLFTSQLTYTANAGETITVIARNSDGCDSPATIQVVNAVPAIPDTAQFILSQPTCANPLGTITVLSPLGVDYSLDGVNFQQSNVFNNVAPGADYIITVRNAAGCLSVTTIPVVIIPATNTVAPIVANITQPACGMPTGTIEITTPLDAALQYSIDGVNYQDSPIFINIASGTYTVTAQNNFGCTSQQEVVINNAPALPSIGTTQGCVATVSGTRYILQTDALNNSFDITTANYEWRIVGGAEVGSNQNTFDVTGYATANNLTMTDFPLEFQVTVTTADGCESTALVTVDGIFCTIPKGISPNNDSLNDNFNLTGLDVKNLSIFNRYGTEVYQYNNNYTNQWYGQSDNGKELPTGTYYYVIEPVNGETKTGWVYINREE